MSKPGYKIWLAAQYVADHPGCAILPVAEYVGPHGSRQFGYRIVHRAIKAGMIKASRDKKTGRYSLEVSQNEV